MRERRDLLTAVRAAILRTAFLAEDVFAIILSLGAQSGLSSGAVPFRRVKRPVLQIKSAAPMPPGGDVIVSAGASVNRFSAPPGGKDRHSGLADGAKKTGPARLFDPFDRTGAPFCQTRLALAAIDLEAMLEMTRAAINFFKIV